MDDSAHLRYLEWANTKRRTVEWWLPGAGGKESGEQCLIGTVSVVPDEKGSRDGRRRPGTASVRSTSEYALRNRADG